MKYYSLTCGITIYEKIVIEKQALTLSDLMIMLNRSSRSIAYYISSINMVLSELMLFKEIRFNGEYYICVDI